MKGSTMKPSRPPFVIALQQMGKKKYWNKENTVEFFAFLVKAFIIVPGLVFGIQIWWLYIFALISSLMLIWSSTVKTLPTLIWFNIVWSTLAATFLIRFFFFS